MNEAGRISRRDLLKNAGGVAAVGALGASRVLAASQNSTTQSGVEPGEPRTLALIGDRYHNANYIRISLERLFGELGLHIHFTANYDQLSKALLEPYQLFIFFRDERIWPGGYLGPDQWTDARFLENPGDFPPEKPVGWMTEAQGEAVNDFVAAGNGLYSFHNNAFVSRSSKSYREVQGGDIIYRPRPLPNGYPPLRPFKVKIVNRDHPVTQGVEDFMVTDEQYFATYDKDPKNILIHGENLDGLTYAPDYRVRGRLRPESRAAETVASPVRTLGTASISGWAHEHGNGRVVFTAMGGTIHSMWKTEYLKMQKNAVRWLLKMT